MEISYSRQAIKFLSKQDERSRTRIVAAIERIPAGNIKKLQGQDRYRLRVGEVRVIFDRMGNVIFIEAIDYRGDVYK